MEEELIFKRFPTDKQDQVRGLVEYATLMGLSGKDLISIGGKLDRLKAAREKSANIEIIKAFDCMPIGQDKTRRDREAVLDERFKLKTATGSYNFESDYGGYKVTSASTRKTVYHTADHWDHEIGRVSWRRRNRYNTLLDISKGKLVLNF